MKKICGFAPASIANLSVGFDVLGMALNSIGDKVELVQNELGKNQIIEIINGPGLPKSTDKNCCSVVIKKMQEDLGEVRGVDIRIFKGFESGSGLGSSSASSAAAAISYNELMGNPFSRMELIKYAAAGEEIASGSAHADNVAPSLLGGLVLVRQHQPLDIVKLPVPDSLYVVVLFPKVKINTRDSRSVMQRNISLKAATGQWANMGAFVASLYENDMELFSRSMVDLVAEPVRSLLIPKFSEVKESALREGALSVGISGSGPSVFALTNDLKKAERIKTSMEKVFESTSIDTMSFIESASESRGARIVESI